MTLRKCILCVAACLLCIASADVSPQAVDRMLQDLQDTSQQQQLEKEVAELIQESSRLQALQEELLRRTESLKTMIRQVNMIQLDSLISRLNATINMELQHREDIHTEEEEKENDSHAQEGVSLSDLEEVLDPARIMAESEEELENWMIDMAPEEAATVVQKQGAVPKHQTCVDFVEAVETVQQALTRHSQDGVGQFDHAAAGASIVHQHTSETFVPPLPQQELGNVWWRRYIPQDWERLLPLGWERWSADFPSYISHSVGLPSNGPAPPEQILNPNTHIGSCWPMAGRNGQVMIRLPYPVKVSAVTLDHAPLRLLNDQEVGSAPRKVKIVGYPPCSSSDKECNGVGFDLERDAFDLVSFEYQVENEMVRSAQTFSVAEEEQEDGDAVGECSETATSCGAPPEMMLGNKNTSSSADVVAGGIMVQVLDNWGNEDFTCIYRLRVHGEALYSVG